MGGGGGFPDLLQYYIGSAKIITVIGWVGVGGVEVNINLNFV